MQNIMDEILSYSNIGIKFGLENIKSIMNNLGNPQNNYKSIHIAGTNGKGSTAAFIESAVIKAGYKVGKYTSPHLIRLNERIVINREQITDEDLLLCFKRVKETIEKLQIKATFFEIITAIMFLYFKQKEVEWAILETGMGGRLDSTNIVIPELSIITNISMDHASFLGDTIYEIATEKAGIIKDNVPVIFCDSKPDVKKAISEKTDDYINVIDEDFEFNLDTNEFKTVVKFRDAIFDIPLFGEHQAFNFMTAFVALEKIGINREMIVDSLPKVKWAGRLEIYNVSPKVIVDGAHNIEAARFLRKSILSFSNPSENVIIASIMNDKEGEDVFNEFSKMSKSCIFTSLDTFKRGQTAKELAKKWSRYFDETYTFDDVKKAYSFAQGLDKNIIVTGSLYLVGEFKREVMGE